MNTQAPRSPRRPSQLASRATTPARSRAQRRAQAREAESRAPRRLAAWRRWLRWPRVSALLRRLLAAVLGAGAIVWAAGPVYAQVAPGTLPQGGAVVTGQGHLQAGANLLTIVQASDRLGIDWRSFSIGRDALVEFLQPGPGSIALNRVVGHDASQIYGRLRANGQVFLTNPNGVLFAPGAKVDVGGLVASALDVSQADFAAGRDVFRAAPGSSGSVVNEGELNATAGGYLALFGATVDNRGDLRVDAGSVVLASGRAATISISGGGLISAVVEPGIAGAVLNSGRVAADGGSVTLNAASADALASSLVNNSGIVRANALEDRGGEIWITGDRVVHSGVLQADGSGNADGGRVSVKGDMAHGSLAVSGTISARSERGQGGQVETSAAKVEIDGSARVNTLGAGRRHGTWLIDPSNFTVSDGSAPSSASGIGASTLSTNLGLGNVALATAADGAEAGDLFVNAAVSWSADTQLSLTAHRHVEINANITATGDAAGLAVTTGTSGNFTIATGSRVRLPGPNSSFSLGGTGYTMLRSLADLRAIDGGTAALAGRYALADDLDASESATVAFSPIGNEASVSVTAANAFGGQFQGLGNAIQGLVVDLPTSNATGLFAQLSNARVENLRLEGGRIAGSQFAGAVAGVITGSSTIVNVHSDLDVTVVDDASTGVWGGGLFGSSPIGVTTTVSISRSSASGNVAVDTNTSTARAGGLIAQLARGSLNDVSASGNVSASLRTGTNDTLFYVGGLGGYLSGGVGNATATGDVSGGHETGGLVGRFEAFNASISGGRAEGDVTGSGQTGGLVGYTTVAAGSTAGLSGISNSQASGNVTATGYLANDGLAGGAVGHYNLSTAPVGLSASGNVVATRAAGGVIGYLQSAGVALAAGSIASVVPTGTTRSITAQYWAGGLIGYSAATGAVDGLSFTGDVATTTAVVGGGAGGLMGRSNGAVRNSSSTGTVNAVHSAGGLIGVANGAGGFENVSSSASVTSDSTRTDAGVGGLVGEYAHAGTLDGGTASGNVRGGARTGGLVGDASSATADTSISNSSATGNVDGSNLAGTGGALYAGGLVGRYAMPGTMNTVSASGTVSNGGYAGGLIGFFDSTAELGNATQDGATVTGIEYVGGLVGYSRASLIGNASAVADVVATGTGTRYAGGLAGRTGGRVDTASATGSVVATATTGTAHVGGLIGRAEGTGVLLDGLTASGTVSAATTGASGTAGGLIGWATQGSITFATASGSTSGGLYVGGLVGYFEPSTGSIADSSASGNVTSRGDAGGLVGFARGTGTITDSSASGDVSSSATSTYSVGGVVGHSAMTLGVSNLSATGTVSGGVQLGGVVGNLVGGSATGLTTTQGSVSGTGSSLWVGGLVGYATGTALSGLSSAVVVGHIGTSGGAGGILGGLTGVLSDSSASGSVSSGSSAGGLVGVVSGSGGVTQSSATGNVSTSGAEAGTHYAGGAVGHYNGTAAPVNLRASGNVSGGNTAGGVIGYLQSNVALPTGSVLSVVPDGSTKTVSGPRWVGGLVGYSNSTAAASGLSFVGNVTASGSVGAAGGLMGRSNGPVTGSTSSGTVSGGGDAGGLIGRADGAGGFSGLSSSATVAGGSTTGHVGGLVGEYVNSGAMATVSASGNVSGGVNTGGLVGFYNSGGALSAASHTGSSVVGTQNTGGLVGYANAGTMDNVSAIADVTSSGVGTRYVGGLAGRTGGTISNATATGDVLASGDTGLAYVGGLIGHAEGSGGVTDGSASGNVTNDSANSSPATGGLIGYVSNGGVIRGNATGAVSGGLYVGGLVGRFSPSTGTISASSASGAVDSRGDAGGLVGFASGTGAITTSDATGSVSSAAISTYSAGGAIGYTQMSGGVNDVSAAGNVTGGAQTGGVIGYHNTTAAHTAISTTATSVSGSTWVGGLVGYSAAASISGLTATVNVTGTSAGGAVGGLAGFTAGAVSDSSASGSVSSASSAGGLIGRADGTGAKSGLSASGNVSSSATGAVSVGGLIGDVNGGALSASDATGAVSGGYYVGGLIGSYNVNASIDDVSATGSVSTTLAGQVGGLIGGASGTGSLTNATATGQVSGAGSAETGGLVGRFTKSGGMAGVSATGDVSGGSRVGGLVGYFVNAGSLDGATASGSVSGSTYVGGLIGEFTNSGDLRNATATGSVIAGNIGGGLVGQFYNSGASLNLRADGNVTANGTAGGLFGIWNYSTSLTDSLASGHVSSAGVAGGLIGEGYDNDIGIINSRASGSVRGSTYVGGLVGIIGYTHIERGQASGAVTGISTTTSTLYVGGLVGQFYNYDATGGIVDSNASGTVSTDSRYSYTGGLVGYHYAGDLLRNSASGAVAAADSTNASSRDHSSGGLIGYYSANGNDVFSDNTASGNVSSAGTAGGLLGQAYGSSASLPLADSAATGNVSGLNQVGGLVGSLNYVGINNGTATGHVTNREANGTAGGLVGGYSPYYANGLISDSRASGNVSGGNYGGGLVGEFRQYSSTAGGTLGVVSSQATGDVSGARVAGGLIGRYEAFYGSGSGSASTDLGIRDSRATGAVQGNYAAGGLVGEHIGYGGIQRSMASGNVTLVYIGSSGEAGGLVGEHVGLSGPAGSGLISQSTASGHVSLETTAAPGTFTELFGGGLVGRLVGPSATAVTIADSYATGDVTLAADTGRMRAGGLVGSLDSSIERTYATGAVVATGDASTRLTGGLVAQSRRTGTTDTASYWATDSTGQASSVLGTASTLEAMRDPATFEGWDIATVGGSDAVWRQYAGRSLPLLRNFLSPLTLVLGDLSRVYDGSSGLGVEPVLIGSVLVTNPQEITVFGDAINVGAYTITGDNLTSTQGGYDLVLDGTATLTITQRPLTLSGVVLDKVYDGTTAATLAASPALGNLVPGEDLNFVPGTGFSAIFETRSAGVGKNVLLGGSYSITDGSVGRASNYQLPTGLTTTATIAPKPVTVGAITAVDRVYDGSNVVVVNAAGGSIDGVVGSDVVSFDAASITAGTIPDKNVGTRPVTVSGAALTGADAGNYLIAGLGAIDVVIAPKALTLNGLDANDRQYNRGVRVSINTSSASLAGVVTGDLVLPQTSGLYGETADKNVGDGKAVTVFGAGLRGPDALNYTVTPGAVTVNITPYQLTVYLSHTGSSTREYDGTANASTFWPTYWYSGDDLTVNASAIGYADKNVARDGSGAVVNKTITASDLTLSGADAGNYALQNSTATLSGRITPKPLSVSGVAAIDRVYDGTRDVQVDIGSATVDTTGIIGSDDVSVSTPSGGTVIGQVETKNVGTNKPVTVPGLALTGTDAGNYTITGSGSGVTVDISAKDLTATYTGQDKVYDGNAQAVVTATLSGVVVGDTVTQYVNVFCTYVGSGCAQFYLPAPGGGIPTDPVTDRNVGTDKTVLVTYNDLRGADAGNYRLLNPTGAAAPADITPKPVTLVFNGNSKVYDGGTAAPVTLNIGSSGLYSVDGITATQTAVFTGDGAKNVGSGKPITISDIVAGGAGIGNYTILNTTATATGSVTAKAVVLSGITATNRAYDGTTSVEVSAPGDVGSSGFIDGDIVTVSLPPGGLSLGTIATAGVGSAKPVTVTGLSLSGADAPNYLIDPATSGITVNITPKALTPTYTGVDKVYDGGITASVAASTDGIVGSDVVTFSQLAQYTGSGARNAGTAKPIAVTDIRLGGSSAANYTLATTTASTTGTVLPKPVAPSYVGESRVYNGLADVSAAVLGTSLGFVTGDSVSLAQTAVFSGDGSAGVAKPVVISDITLAGVDAGNYSLTATSASTSATITPRPLSVTGVIASSRVYDGTTTVAVNVSGATVDTSAVVPGDSVAIELPPDGISTGLMADRFVGTAKPVTISGASLTGAESANYVLVGATGLTVNISPRALTASYAALDKVYDGTANASITALPTDLLTVDVGGVGISASGVFSAGKGVGDDKAVAISGGFLTGALAGNYTLASSSGSATADITARLLSLSYGGISKVYDGLASVDVSGTLGGRIGGDLVSTTQSAVFTGDGAKNVGSSKPVAISGIVLTGADAANYRIDGDTRSASGSITPRSITISGLDSVTAVDRVYDGSATVDVVVPTGVTLTPSSSDIVPGDSVTIAVPGSGTTTGTMVDKHAGEGKLVTVSGLSLSGTDAANYRITGTAGVTVDITPLGLTAEWAGVNRVYDGSTTAQASGSSAGLIGGDSVLIRGSGRFTDGKNVGSDKPIEITGGTLSGSDARNYTLLNTTGSASADVTPRLVTPGYGVVDKVYDGTTTAAVVGSFSGLIAGDAVSSTQAAVFTGPGAKNVGTAKPVSVSDIALSGADAGNYTLSADTATTTGRITPKPITLTGLTGVTATDRAYDGSTSVAVNISGSGPVTVDPAAVVPGDEVSVNPGVGGSTTGTMADKHVGTAKAVVVDGLALIGADAANYRVAATEGVTVNITPRSLTAVYAGVDKVYDGSDAATVAGNSADILGGDSVGIGGSARFSAGRNVGNDLEVLVTGALLTGSDARNYLLTNPTGSASADITPKTLNASYSGGTRVYDGTLLAPVTGLLSGLVAGDAVTLSQTALFTGDGAKNVGVGKAVSVTGIALGGGDAGNYLLAADATTTTATVTPRPLRIIGLTGVTAADRVYDGTRDVTVTVTTSGPITPEPGDLIDGDVVTLTAPPAGTTTGLMADKNVGTAKPVAVSGLTIGGADAINYSVAETAGVTVNITPKALTPVFIGISRPYDGTVVATTGGSSADIVAGDSVLIRGTGVFSGDGARNAGLNKPIDVTAAMLAGADGANYLLTTTTGSAVADITPRTLSTLYAGVSREYDGSSVATVTRSVGGVIAGDSVTVSESATFTDGKNVGSAKPVLVSGIALSGADALNYRVDASTASTTASVTPRRLVVTGLSGLSATDRLYDGTLEVDVSFSGGGGSTGASNIVPGDDVSVSVDGGGVGGGRLLDKHAGLAKPVTLSGLTLSGADAGNYLVGGIDGLTVNIAPRPVSLSGVAAVGRAYDGSTAVAVDTSAATIAGAIGGDALSLRADAFGNMADKHVGVDKPVSVAGLALAGDEARNYVVVDSAPITVSITPRLLNAIYTGVNRVYDGSTAATVAVTAAELIVGDAVSLGTSAAFTGPGARNAGIDKPISVNDTLLAGADAGNYQLMATTGTATASILPRPLSAGATVAPRVYDGTTTASVALVGGGAIDGDAISLTGTATYTGDGARNVGTNKPVTVAGLTLSGADAGNYTLDGVSSLVTTGTITPRPLTVTVTALDKTYDGDTAASVSISSDRIAGDDLLLSAAGARFEQADAGTGLRVSLGGLEASGADRGNYSLPGSLAETTATIRRAPLLISAGALDKVYGTALVPLGTEFSASGLVAGQTVGGVTLASDALAALAPVTGSPYALLPSAAGGGSFNPANYDIGYVAGSVVVRPRTVTISSDFVLAYEDALADVQFGATVTGLLPGLGHGVTGLVAPTPDVRGAIGGSRITLLHSGGTVTGTEARNYELRYEAGRLLVLPRPVRLDDPANDGGGDGGLGISSFTPQEVAAAEQALAETLRVLNAPVAGDGTVGPGLRPPATPGGLSAADIAALFGNDARQITLPALQRLPLINLDPTLRRLLGALLTP